MPSWRDGSSGDSYSFLDHVQSDSSDLLGCGRQVEDGWPDWIRDPDYNGEETDVEMRCFCDLPMSRYVAFHGTNLGRKFLGCQHEDEKRCTYVHWVDPVWRHMYKEAYKNLIYPVPGQHGWTKTDTRDIDPPQYETKRGRKQKKRRRGPHEPSQATVQCRMTTIKCSNCKAQGHRYTNCRQPLKPHLAARKAGHKVIFCCSFIFRPIKH